MHETDRDLKQLQRLLDRSYQAAGSHLLTIHTPDRRLDAAEVAQRLTGLCLLALATVTADHRPIVGPVDGVLYRGSVGGGAGRPGAASPLASPLVYSNSPIWWASPTSSRLAQCSATRPFSIR